MFGQATGHHRLGELIGNGIQHLAQLRDHVEPPGDLSVGKIRQPGQHQNPNRQVVILLLLGVPVKIGEHPCQHQPKGAEQIGNGQNLMAAIRTWLHIKVPPRFDFWECPPRRPPPASRDRNRSGAESGADIFDGFSSLTFSFINILSSL